MKNFEPVIEMVGKAAAVDRKVVRHKPIAAFENNMSFSVGVLVSGQVIFSLVVLSINNSECWLCGWWQMLCARFSI